jgi:hypothetical protein
VREEKMSVMENKECIVIEKKKNVKENGHVGNIGIHLKSNVVKG